MLTSLLVLPDDVLFLILALLPAKELRILSTLNTRLRDCGFSRVFRTICLGPQLSINNLHHALTTLHNCIAFEKNVRAMKIKEICPPDADVMPEAFDRCIESLVIWVATKALRLEALEVDEAMETTQLLQHYLKPFGALPSIKNLTVGLGVESLISFCPNVETITTGSSFNSDLSFSYANFIRRAGEARNLQRLAMHGRWTTSSMDSICRTVPHLRGLSILSGRVSSNLNYETLTSLSRLHELEYLQLSEDFNFEGLSLKELLRGLDWGEQARLEIVQNKIMRFALTKWPKLREFRVEDVFQARVMGQRQKEGVASVKVQWEYIVPLLPCSVSTLELFERKRLFAIEEGLGKWIGGRFDVIF